MRPRSVYVIDCPCGNKIESNSPNTVCLKCGTHLEVRGWGEMPAVQRVSEAAAQ